MRWKFHAASLPVIVDQQNIEPRLLENTVFFPDGAPAVKAKYDVHVPSAVHTHIHEYETLSYTCKYSSRLSLSRTLRHGYMLIHPSAGIRSLNRLYLWIPEWLVSLKAYLAFKARVRLHVFRGKHFPGALG